MNENIEIVTILDDGWYSFTNLSNMLRAYRSFDTKCLAHHPNKKILTESKQNQLKELMKSTQYRDLHKIFYVIAISSLDEHKFTVRFLHTNLTKDIIDIERKGDIFWIKNYGITFLANNKEYKDSMNNAKIENGGECVLISNVK